MDTRVAAASTPLMEEEVVQQIDGLHTYLSVKAPLRDSSGKISGVFGISTDITERKRAEERLRVQAERLSMLDRSTRAIGERQDLHSIFQVAIRSLEEHLPIDFGCVCLYEPTGQTLEISCVGAKSHELALELALTEHARIGIDQNGLARCVRGQLVYEADVSGSAFPFPARLARAGLRSLVIAPLSVENRVFGVMITARRDPNSFASADCEFLRQLSEHLALAAHQAQLYGSLQRAYEDLRQSQASVIQQERLRALGQMASGIAHDINNALSPAALYAQSLLERDHSLSSTAREYLAVIERAIEDVGHTVARMRMFSRPRDAELTLSRVDLNLLVQQVAELTRARWYDIPQERGIVIDLKSELAPDLPPIMGAGHEIRDALTNLIFNAVDAMPEGGTLTLRSKAGADGSSGRDGSFSAQISVEITDTGIGMTEEVRSRCLEPFYTTKGERGTGLGLAMVYGMVQRHSAGLEIDSALGAGTTVRLIFSAATPLAEVAQAAIAVHPPQPLRILLVDDDPLLLKSLKDVLESEGHSVTPADGGQRGIDEFLAAEKRREPFAVVITDLGMPKIDGRTVAAAIKSAAPATPVILLTGWGHRLQSEGELPEHVNRVLSKPPRIAALRMALAELTLGG
jgi:signal transduction histidine kinase/ActR/RegA family two-component response regulator